jgi:hypothetical protein
MVRRERSTKAFRPEKEGCCFSCHARRRARPSFSLGLAALVCAEVMVVWKRRKMACALAAQANWRPIGCGVWGGAATSEILMEVPSRLGKRGLTRLITIDDTVAGDGL